MSKIIKGAGCFLQIVAYILMLVGGLVAVWVCFGICKLVLGPIGAYLGLVIFPALLAVAPPYALFAWGAWKPIVFVWGLGIVVTVLFGLASQLTGEEY